MVMLTEPGTVDRGRAAGVLTHSGPPALSQQESRMAYSRVHHSIIDDPRFEHVYPNDAALAAWLRLLLVADATFPAPAPWPLGLRPKTLEILLESGLIERVGATHYRVHGLASEREKRSQSARNAAAVRWQSAAMPSKEEHRKEEQTRAQERAPKNGSPTIIDAYRKLDLPVDA
jgi:hypothetical protein